MQKTINFVKYFKFYIFIPLAFMVLGVFFNIFAGINLSIDFSGGTKVTYSYEGDIDLENVKKNVEGSLSSAGNETFLKYSFTGTVDGDAVADTLNQDEDLNQDVSYSAEITSEGDKSILNITSIGKKLLSDDVIKNVTAALNSNYADNKITYDSKTTDKYEDIQVEVTETRDYTTDTSSIVISVIGNTSVSTAQLEEVETNLTTEFAANNLELSESNTVDATVGSSFFGKSLYAVGLASLLVVLYVGYRFRKVGGIKAAICALIALVHDLLIVYFVDVVFGLTIDSNFIAVVLTILGYSLNDTIVIYDRVRENKLIYGNKKTTRELVNLSISQSLKRSVVTSVTTFVAILSVTIVAAVAGLDSILTFSIPMSIGVVTGTFSSICVAGPLYVFWCEHTEKKGIKKDKAAKAENAKAVNYTNKINPKNGKKKVY